MFSVKEKKREFVIDDWGEFLAESKKTFDACYEKEPKKSEYSIGDFEFIQTLNYGVLNRLTLCRLVAENKYYTLKIFKKQKIVRQKIPSCIHSHRKVLDCLTPIAFHLLTSLKCAFQDNCYIYFCEPFVNGGDLNSHLKTLERFSERESAFFGAQAVLALEFLHNLGLVFRDIKPENFLVDDCGYVKVCNFNFCKKIDGSRTYTICGSAEYMAPEMVFHRGYGRSVDWWSLGIFLYELNSGTTPFLSEDRIKMLEKLQIGEFDVPIYFSGELNSLVRRLVQRDISKRYGVLKNGVRDIKSHRWFKNIDWAGILRREVKPPFRPHVRGPADLTHFGTFQEHPLETSTTNQYADYFEGF